MGHQYKDMKTTHHSRQFKSGDDVTKLQKRNKYFSLLDISYLYQCSSHHILIISLTLEEGIWERVLPRILHPLRRQLKHIPDTH